MNILSKSLRQVAAAALATALIAGSANAAEKLKIGFIYPSPVGDVGWARELDEGRKKIEAAGGPEAGHQFHSCQRLQNG